MIFVFIVMLFGLWTVFRTLNFFVRERFLPRERQILIVFCISTVQFLISSHISNSYFGMWSLALFPILAAKITFTVLTFIREKRFKDTFSQFLDDIIIEMRAGQSFRSSLSKANEKTEPFVQQKIRKVIEMIRFSIPINETQEPFIGSILEEFRRIDENSHNSLQRLLSFRHKLRVESDYRRRSGQAVLQIRAQAGVLIVLYFATALFVFTQLSIDKIGIEILLSFLLFFIGTAIVFMYGRGYKWKV